MFCGPNVYTGIRHICRKVNEYHLHKQNFENQNNTLFGSEEEEILCFVHTVQKFFIDYEFQKKKIK